MRPRCECSLMVRRYVEAFCSSRFIPPTSDRTPGSQASQLHNWRQAGHDQGGGETSPAHSVVVGPPVYPVAGLSSTVRYQQQEQIGKSLITWEIPSNCPRTMPVRNNFPALLSTEGKSGRVDLNHRPLAPHASALAKLRHAPKGTTIYCDWRWQANFFFRRATICCGVAGAADDEERSKSMSTDTMDRADLVRGRQLPELLHQPSTYHHQDADEQDRQRESQDCDGDLRADCVAGIGPEYRQSEWAKSGYAHHDSVSGMVPSPLRPIGRADPPTTERT